MLLKACQGGAIEEVRKCAHIEGVINLRNAHGWSALMVVAFHGPHEVVRLLVECGANVNETNYNGTSVLMYAKDGAISSGDVTSFIFLLGRGANVNVRDNRNRTLLGYLSDSPPSEILKLLALH